jgi:rhodanese-related sulfurtransferase
VAIRVGMTAFDLTRLELCYAPPYSSAKDPVNMAGYVIENVLTGQVKNFHWHEVGALLRDGSATLLDVRFPQEVKQGRIEGFINIPLDSLRENIAKLEKSKPVYIHCHSGMRSYIAARILMQHGFDVYNLSGGFRLYNAVKSGT